MVRSFASRNAGLSSVLHRNIEALREKRQAERARASAQDRIADVMTGFAGTMLFIYIHAALVVVWVIWNLALVPGLKPFDASFVILATVASVEAIFISTFVLISQNRAAAAADRRADLDLQINLLAEHEITRLLTLVVAIAERLEIPDVQAADLAELQKVVVPEDVLERIEAEEEKAEGL